MATTRLIEAELASGLVPGPVGYAVLLPAGYEESGEAYPLLFFLHGGGGDRSFLTRLRPAIEAVWAAGTLPPVVVVTPSVSRCEYMDYRDGSQKWERFLLTEFPEHLRQSYRLRTDRQGTLLFGISMGGMGGLRVGFKYPDLFGGVAALEAGHRAGPGLPGHPAPGPLLAVGQAVRDHLRPAGGRGLLGGEQPGQYRPGRRGPHPGLEPGHLPGLRRRGQLSPQRGHGVPAPHPV